jgi:hypothetical protein
MKTISEPLLLGKAVSESEKNHKMKTILGPLLLG